VDGEEEILSRSPSSFDGPGVVVVVYDGCIMNEQRIDL